jgi:nicotinate-nucleotide adenylyltransferase
MEDAGAVMGQGTDPDGPIGFLGGSFDPVHFGHLQLARDAQQALGLAQLRFVPAGRPWQKSGLTASLERVRMLELALAGVAGWSIDLREVERAGPTYTVDTARELRAEAGPRRPLVWIMGFDQLRRLPSWHRWDELLDLVHIAYADRAGSEPGLDATMQELVLRQRGDRAQLAQQAAGRLLRFAMAAVDCSATAVRQALRRGDEAYAARYVPAPVLDYIGRQHLYVTEYGNEKTATPGD